MTSSATKPFLYCDVDGVINIAARKAQGAMVNTIHRSIPTMEKILPHVPIRFQWKQDVVGQLAALPVRFIWLTTWNYQAVKFLEPLTGIKSENVLPYKMTVRELRNQKHKYDLLKTHQQENPAPFIWIDDVATRFFNPGHWENTGHHLVIKPNSRQGITQDHLDSIEKFLGNFNPTQPQAH